MKNRLLTDRWRSMAGPLLDESRCSGRTTALGLAAIARAIQNPNHWVALEDHHGTPNADRRLQERCCDLVDQLGLKHFEFRRAGLRPELRCNLFVPS